MTAQELFELVKAKAKFLGLNEKNDRQTIIDPKGNAIIRENIADLAFTDKKAYFGFIGEEEETSGAYSDFSFVIFPEKELGACVVALGVGSSGFKNDYQLAVQPGTRRDFLKLKSDKTFFKTNFSDIESTSSELLKAVKNNCPALAKVIEVYKTVLPAAVIIDEVNDEIGRGVEPVKALVESSCSRLRPVMMASLTGRFPIISTGNAFKSSTRPRRF